MPSEHMIPGLFGKIPATGDFVTRRLQRDFVRFWDRLAARHLAPLLKAGLWPADRGLRFLATVEGRGPLAGVAVPSSDRVGRLFPLTAAASCPHAGPDTISDAADWFDRVEGVLATARDLGTDADGLAEALARLRFPSLPASKAPRFKRLWLWTDGRPLVEVDPETPQGALEELLTPMSEAE